MLRMSMLRISILCITKLRISMLRVRDSLIHFTDSRVEEVLVLSMQTRSLATKGEFILKFDRGLLHSTGLTLLCDPYMTRQHIRAI